MTHQEPPLTRKGIIADLKIDVAKLQKNMTTVKTSVKRLKNRHDAANDILGHHKIRLKVLERAST